MPNGIVFVTDVINVKCCANVNDRLNLDLVCSGCKAQTLLKPVLFLHTIFSITCNDEIGYYPFYLFFLNFLHALF